MDSCFPEIPEDQIQVQGDKMLALIKDCDSLPLPEWGPVGECVDELLPIDLNKRTVASNPDQSDSEDDTKEQNKPEKQKVVDKKKGKGERQGAKEKSTETKTREEEGPRSVSNSKPFHRNVFPSR